MSNSLALLVDHVTTYRHGSTFTHSKKKKKKTKTKILKNNNKGTNSHSKYIKSSVESFKLDIHTEVFNKKNIYKSLFLLCVFR